MADTTKEQHAESGTVRLPKELVRKLGIIAQHSDRAIGEIVAGWIGPRVNKEYRETVRSMTVELGGEGG